MDIVHGALDVAGFIPGLGAVADVLNAGIYLVEGNYGEAAWAMAAAVPGVGDVAAGARLARNGAELLARHGDEAVDAARGGTEVVQRAMSRAELDATVDTGLVRGGRGGEHFVSDAVNTNANRARQRLALPQTPEVRVDLEVPTGVFSSPTRVTPDFNMPGGGMERSATGAVPARVIKVWEYG